MRQTAVTLPEALRDALGQVIANERREWRRERELIEAEARAAVAELKAQNVALLARLEDAITTRLASLQNGKDGRDGVDGRDGAPGEQGPPGEPGRPGVDGAPGRDGKDGADGRDGVDGRDGSDGAPGRDGVDGAAGVDGAMAIRGNCPWCGRGATASTMPARSSPMAAVYGRRSGTPGASRRMMTGYASSLRAVTAPMAGR